MDRILVGALAVGIAFVIKIPFCRLMDTNAFGMLNLIYFDMVILVPAVALILLSFSRSMFKTTRPVRVVSIFALLAAPIGVYASLIEPENLQKVEAQVTVDSSRALIPPIRVGVLADIQTDKVSEYESTAIARFMSEKPDLILIAGDLFQGSREEFEQAMSSVKAMLMPLDAPGGVFFAMGDVDWWREDQVRRALSGTHVRPLVNEIARVIFGDRQVTIGSVGLHYDSNEALNTIRNLENEEGSNDLRILLAHRPDVAFEVKPSSRIDLIVAGHTHGGQVCLPFFGPLITLSNVPRQVAAGGLHKMLDNQIYLSRGIGHERGQAPRVRFLCPPEFSILTISSRPPSLAKADR